MNLSRRYHLNIKLSTFIGPSLKIQLPFLVQQNLELQLPSELLQTYSYSLPFLVQQYLELQLPSELLQTYSHSVKYTPILQTHSQNANSTLGGANIYSEIYDDMRHAKDHL